MKVAMAMLVMLVDREPAAAAALAEVLEPAGTTTPALAAGTAVHTVVVVVALTVFLLTTGLATAQAVQYA